MTHRHSYYHPTEHRYLTQREAAAIQSFPNNFIFEGTVSSQWRQIGNAVPPLLGKALGKAIISMYKKAEIKSSKTIKKKTIKEIQNVRSNAFKYRLQK
jgi:DNA (cytosine-5)-methyltransferase 1